jgi:hypothetical protein
MLIHRTHSSSSKAFLVVLNSFTIGSSNVFIIHSRCSCLLTEMKLATTNSLDCDSPAILAIERTYAFGVFSKGYQISLSLSLSGSPNVLLGH